VKLTPTEPSTSAKEAGIGRLAIAKAFHGELEATTRGEMLAFRSPVEGSAGYVAIERVTGTLAGRRGIFTLQRHGLRERGENRLVIDVVPDSADGELAGLRGRMGITIGPTGEHAYDFAWELPASAPSS